MVKYNKNGTATKGDRLLHSGGPRDRQRKLAEQESIRDLQNLKKELSDLTTNMGAKDVGYSKEQVRTLVNDSIEEVSVDLETKYIKELKELRASVASKDVIISNLTDTITKLEDKLDKRDDTIMELTSKVSAMASRGYVAQPTEDVEDPSRPSIDKIFIDPTEKGAEDKYESHVTVKEEQSEKTNVTSEVDKLKALMGNKLPKI